MVWISKVDGRIPVALTIAGSDSGGGAGIQADLKTFAALGVHGAVAVTAITAQNSTGVYGVQEIDVDLIRRQIEVVVEDLGVDAAKTGMLYTSEIIEAVVKEVNRYSFPLVVDPVMVAKSGAPLLKEEAVNALVNKLIPKSTIVTPNKFEAERIAGLEIKTIEDVKNALRKIAELGPKAVVIKGGHIDGGKSMDMLYLNGEFKVFEFPRISTKNTHGTGCSFSAAIAGLLARGLNVSEAVRKAKELVFHAIKYGLPVGRGYGSVNPLATVYRDSEKYSVLKELLSAFKSLSSNERVYELVPEVRMNFVYALPQADSIKDVAGFPGRITFNGEKLAFTSFPSFGASKHVASAVLAIMRYDESMRSALNLRYDEELVKKARELGFKVAEFKRSEEPEEVRRVEGGTLPWGVREAVEDLGEVPDLIYDLGGVGKEPMIRLFGRDPREVVEKLFKLIEDA